MKIQCICKYEEYNNISQKFSFRLNFKQSDEGIRKNAIILINGYPEDVNASLYGHKTLRPYIIIIIIIIIIMYVHNVAFYTYIPLSRKTIKPKI